MKLLNVGAAALNQTPLDWPGNLQRILRAIEEARAKHVSVLCLPELCISGYGCEDMFYAPHVHRTAWKQLESAAQKTRGLIAIAGLPVAHLGGIYDTVAVLADGRIEGLVPKKFLAGDGIHYEPRWFKAWPLGARGQYQAPSGMIPIGDLYFDFNGVRLGLEICEEAWVANRPGALLAQKGVDLLLNPSASHFSFGKQEVRKRFVIDGSRAFGVAYVYANLLGNEAGRAIYDGGSLIASGGRLLAEGPRLGFKDIVLTTAQVDLEVNRMNRSRAASYAPEIEARDSSRVALPFAPPEARDGAAPVGQTAGWEKGVFIKEEEFLRAAALGLFDYQRKAGMRGFVVSLSGGIDSAVVACLVAFSTHLATAELGLDGLKRRLAYNPELADPNTAQALVRRLLTCVYQSTRNSSKTTSEAAQNVAAALGAEFHRWDIEPLVTDYTRLAAEALGRPVRWESDDLSLQNIQARARAPGVWMLANLRGALLLTTSNRSEAAVGYATMDGDTSGGLAPIAGIDKAFLKEWIRWLETKGPDGLFPLPALAAVTRQAPTAELRPPRAAQTDESDLMPYEVLDWIERAFIRDKESPREIYARLQALHGDVPKETLKLWVQRFFRLWSRNQWKRERYAPSFHLDDENLDPRTWCRFPILSGGFETELESLD